MRKRVLLLITAMVCVLTLAGCKCKHQWMAATCDTPKTCSKCDETEGSALGHNWKDATCVTAKTCGTCGLVSGDPLGHTWTDASCVAPKTCSVCGETEGELLEHIWEEATCAVPKTCSVCGATEGEPLAHTWVDANYQQPKTCSVCGATEGDPVPSFFEENDISVQTAEVGKEYSFTADGIPFVVCLESWEAVESGESYMAVDGYEWRKAVVRIEAQGHQDDLDGSLPVIFEACDYYDLPGYYSSTETKNEKDPVVTGFTVNHLGQEYAECLHVLEEVEILKPQTDDNGEEHSWMQITIASYLTPADYDGLVFWLADASRLEETYEGNFEKLFTDENTFYLRVK